MPNQDEYRPSTATPGVEDWRPIPGFARYEFSLYSAGDSRPLGHVRSPTGRRLKPWTSKDGYRTFQLLADGKHRYGRAHSLCLAVYVGPRPPGAVTRHLDGDSLNNHPDNLRWGTQRENMADRDRHGTTVRGARCSRARLREADIEPILRALVEGQPREMVAARYGVTDDAIGSMINGGAWRHVTAREPCAALLTLYSAKYPAGTKGERNGRATIRAADIEPMLLALLAGQSATSVATRYGVTRDVLANITRRNGSWKHVTSVEPCRSLLAELQSRSGR